MKLTKYIAVTHKIFDCSDQKQKVVVYGLLNDVAYLIDVYKWDCICNDDYSSISEDLINSLMKDRILIDDCENETKLIIQEDLKNQSRLEPGLTIVIQVTDSCNLGCFYCGQQHGGVKLDKKFYTYIVKRLGDKLSKGGYKQLEIVWYGGEPLCSFNTIKDLTVLFKELTKQFSIKYKPVIFTNGFLINKRLAQNLVEDFEIKLFEITLDGISAFHDERRYTHKGKKSFNTIYNNILELQETIDSLGSGSDAQISIRCNVDARNKDGILPLLEKIKKDGFHDKIIFSWHAIHSWGNDAHKFAPPAEMLAKWEIAWLIFMRENDFNVSLIPKRSKINCMAIRPDSELYDPYGNIFNCTEVSLVNTYEKKDGINCYKIGDLINGYRFSEEQINLFNFYKNTIKTLPCNNCFVYPLCGGRCPKQWSENKVACPPFKYNLKERVLLDAIYNEPSRFKPIRLGV